MNTSILAESQLHSPEQTARGIGLYMNENKIEYMCSKLKVTFSTLSGGPLKFVDKFTYFGSNISSTESDVNIRLAKVWAAIDSLSII